MSAVVEALEARHSTDRVERLTQALGSGRPALHWRYDLLSSRHFPVQYYAAALEGQGPDAEELLVIAIECFEPAEGARDRLIVSASITGREGVVLAESSSIEVTLPPAVVIPSDPGQITHITGEVEAALDRLVDWVNGQRGIIEQTLA